MTKKSLADKPKNRQKVEESTVLPPALLGDIWTLIESARTRVSRAVNAGLVLLYWQVGDRIRRDILEEKRAGYGEEILPTLSAKLVAEFGNGFSPRSLARMIRFAELSRERLARVALDKPEKGK